jgi:KaiC/GvpD/RAD55 family RecA-like ATPase
MNNDTQYSNDLPAAPAAERSLLGAILIDGSLLSRVTAILKPEDFASDSNRLVYEACLALADRHDGVDLVTVQCELERTGKLERVGGPAVLSALVDRVPDVENIASYARLVKDAAERRRLILDFRRRADAIGRGEPDEAISVHDEKKSGGVVDIAGILGQSKTSGPRFLTGIAALDERLSPPHDTTKHGMPTGRIVGFNGAPHAGKSVALNQIALSAARAGLRVLMLVTDEPREDAAERIGQGLGFRHAELNADYPETLARVRETECYGNIIILPDENVGPVTIEDAGEILFSVVAEGYVLAVDSLHKSRSRTESDDDSPRVGIEKRLDAFRPIRNKGALVLFSAEANRSFYASSDPAQRASAMASGAESRSIEFTSDALFTLRRDGEDFRVEIPKNRPGRKYEPFTVRLDEGSASFRSIEEEAVKLEKEGRRFEALLPLEDKIVELLRTAPTGMSGHAIEGQRLGPRQDVRDALDSAFKKEKIARLPGRTGGFTYRVDTSSPSSPEARRKLAGEVTPEARQLAAALSRAASLARSERLIGGLSKNPQLSANLEGGS